jgi:hypothetical protein
MKKLVIVGSLIVSSLVTALIYNGYQREENLKKTIEMNRVLDSLALDMYEYEDSLANDLDRFSDSLAKTLE